MGNHTQFNDWLLFCFPSHIWECFICLFTFLACLYGFQRFYCKINSVYWWMYSLYYFVFIVLVIFSVNKLQETPIICHWCLSSLMVISNFKEIDGVFIIILVIKFKWLFKTFIVCLWCVSIFIFKKRTASSLLISDIKVNIWRGKLILVFILR